MKQRVFSLLACCLAVLLYAAPCLADAMEDVHTAIEAGRRGAFELATRMLTQAIESGELSKGEAAMAYNARGLIWFDRGEHDKALADYSKSIELNPYDPDAYYNRAAVLFGKGELEMAQKDLAEATEGYFIRGNRNLDMGDYEKAIQDYTKALEGNPQDTDSLFHRGLAFKRSGQYEAALADLNRSLEIFPDDAPVINSRGSVKKEMGDIDGAMADYTLAIELDPKYADPYYNRALLYDMAGDYEAAVKDFSAVVKIFPNDTEALVKRGQMYQKLENKSKALADFSKAVQIQPDSAILLAIRARAYLGWQDPDKAIADLEKAAAIEPSADVYQLLADAWEMKGEPDTAETFRQRANELLVNTLETPGG